MGGICFPDHFSESTPTLMRTSLNVIGTSVYLENGLAVSETKAQYFREIFSFGIDDGNRNFEIFPNLFVYTLFRNFILVVNWYISIESMLPRKVWQRLELKYSNFKSQIQSHKSKTCFFTTLIFHTLHVQPKTSLVFKSYY